MIHIAFGRIAIKTLFCNHGFIFKFMINSNVIRRLVLCRGVLYAPHISCHNIQMSAAITSMSTHIHNLDILFLSNFLVTLVYQMLCIANGNKASLARRVSFTATVSMSPLLSVPIQFHAAAATDIILHRHLLMFSVCYLCWLAAVCSV